MGATSSKRHDEESGAFVRAKSHRHVTPPLAVAVNRAEDPRGSFNTRILLLRLALSLHFSPRASRLLRNERLVGRNRAHEASP
jgi:hypothetical protein